MPVVSTDISPDVYARRNSLALSNPAVASSICPCVRVRSLSTDPVPLRSLINAYGGTGTSSEPSAYAIIFDHCSADSVAFGNSFKMPSIASICFCALTFVVPVRISGFSGIVTPPVTLTRRAGQNPSRLRSSTPAPGLFAPGSPPMVCLKIFGDSVGRSFKTDLICSGLKTIYSGGLNLSPLNTTPSFSGVSASSALRLASPKDMPCF